MAAKPRKEPEGDPAPGESSGKKAFLLRLSPEVFDALRSWSNQELRSLNSHIEYLLRRALEERRGPRRK